MVFPISLIAYEKMMRKVMLLVKRIGIHFTAELLVLGQIFIINAIALNLVYQMLQWYFQYF